MDAPAAAALPTLTAAWLAEALGAPPADEPRATCRDCAMCGPASTPVRFRPDVKCCSFVPALPNYLVGGLLADPDPALAPGRAAARARIAAGVAVTPLGLGSTPREDALGRLGGERAFGADPALRCPYFVLDTGLCGIWRHREATCATWFCKHTHAGAGERLWRALQRLMQVIEHGLTAWCLTALDLDPAVLDALFPANRPPAPGEQDVGELGAGVLDAEARAAAWGPWLHREEDFYRRCHALVAPLRWPEVRALAGAEVEVHLRLVRHLLAGLAAPLPARAVVALLAVSDLGRSEVELVGYSAYDPVRLPRRLFDALHHFDGRPIAEAVRQIALEEGLVVPDATVRSLLDYGVLVGAD